MIQSIKHIQRLNEKELEKGIPMSASWHAGYSHSAYIYIGGLPYDKEEADIIRVFSQVGEIVDCYLVRDSETGESRGFCFVCFEDQRSTVLAVDNLNGIELGGRTIKVDHSKDFKAPKEYNDDSQPRLYNPSGAEGKGWGEYKRLTEEDLHAPKKLITDEDEMWEKEFMQKVEKRKKKDKKGKKDKKDKSHKKDKSQKKKKHKSKREKKHKKHKTTE